MADAQITTPAEQIISKFGGLTGTAKAIGYPVSTVQGWGERGLIPLKHVPKLLEAARERNIDLTANDFLPTPTERAS